MVLSKIAGHARKEKEARDFMQEELKRNQTFYKKSSLSKQSTDDPESIQHQDVSISSLMAEGEVAPKNAK